jgi:hypothetical protein
VTVPLQRRTHIYGEEPDRPANDAAAAGLVARQRGLLEDEDPGTAPGKRQGRGTAGGTAAHDRNIR